MKKNLGLSVFISLLSVAFLAPLASKAEVPNGVYLLDDGKGYNVSGEQTHLCFLDDNCYNVKDGKFAFRKVGKVAGSATYNTTPSSLTPEQIAQQNLDKIQQDYLAKQEAERKKNPIITIPDVPVLSEVPTTTPQTKIVKDVGDFTCSFNNKFDQFIGYRQVLITCVNSYDFTEATLTKIYGWIPASDFELGNYKTTFGNTFTGPIGINKLCPAKQTCIYTLNFKNAKESPWFTSYYTKLPDLPEDKKQF